MSDPIQTTAVQEIIARAICSLAMWNEREESDGADDIAARVDGMWTVYDMDANEVIKELTRNGYMIVAEQKDRNAL